MSGGLIKVDDLVDWPNYILIFFVFNYRDFDVWEHKRKGNKNKVIIYIAKGKRHKSGKTKIALMTTRCKHFKLHIHITHIHILYIYIYILNILRSFSMTWITHETLFFNAICTFSNALRVRMQIFCRIRRAFYQILTKALVRIRSRTRIVFGSVCKYFLMLLVC